MALKQHLDLLKESLDQKLLKVIEIFKMMSLGLNRFFFYMLGLHG